VHLKLQELVQLLGPELQPLEQQQLEQQQLEQQPAARPLLGLQPAQELGPGFQPGLLLEQGLQVQQPLAQQRHR
jgi:hypothetical protein